MNNYKNNTAAIYMRLSKDDKLDESLSITNQREIITSFCIDNNICIVKEFFDDGWSGGNFERPGFKSLISFIQVNKVDLVITKDLSRLGRDMSEASMYAERYFTERGIRYITVSDNFDSFEDNLYAPFQFAMNDVYIRDASRKVKAVLTQKKKSGQYCSCPPFGYKKSNQRRNTLVPDEMTAPTVKTIFSLAAQGEGARHIADILTNSGVITPLKYRVLYRDDFGEEGAARATDRWCYTTVKRIINNRVYLGDTVLGKTKKISPKSNTKIEVPESEWYVTPNTHEPLVDEKTFELANKNISLRGEKYLEYRKNGQRNSIFRGIVFCENCGSPLETGGSVYNGDAKSYWYLSCRRIPKRDPKHCEHGARIPYYNLVKIITDELNYFIDLSDEQVNDIIMSAKAEDDCQSQNQVIRERCVAIKTEIEDSDKIIIKLYSDNIKGKISDERLSAMVSDIEGKTSELRKTLEALENQCNDTSSKADNYEKFFAIIQKYTHITELTPEIIRAFIDRIEVGEQSAKHKRKTPVTQKIKIFYKFIGEKGFINTNNAD